MQDVYGDLEQLLFKGFISERFHFSGIDFVLKSMSEQEFERVKDRTPSKHPAKNIIYDTWYLAYSVVQANGIYFLEDRDLSAEKLFRSFSKWPHRAISRLVHKCISLSNRVPAAYKKFEAYCYESQSRVYWKAYQGIPLNSRLITGIPGTEYLSLSPLQIQWLTFNKVEDEKVVFDIQWNYVRWVAAFMNQKAAQKIDEEASLQKEKEEMYRKSVMDKARGILDENVELDSPYANKTSRDKEMEKLLYDLDVVINNKKDEHEIAMDQTRASALAEYRRFKEEERDRRIAAINSQAEMSSPSLMFDIIDQKNMVDIDSVDRKRQLLTTVLGVTLEELEAIDKECEVPADIIRSAGSIQPSTRSTILPINFKPNQP